MRLQARFCLTMILSAALVASCADGDTVTATSKSDQGLANTRDAACANRDNNTTAKLLECVTVDGVRAHQAAFQAIADANNGVRAVGTPGYDASLAYVSGKLQAAGYTVTVQPFTFFGFINLAPPQLDQVGPVAASIPTTIFTYSGNGDVTAPVTLVASLGCNAADFAGFPAGDIALISRGSCSFAIKATNAYNAGATAVVIYNNVSGAINGTLGTGFSLNIPVVGIAQADGLQLGATPGLVLRVRTSTFAGEIPSANLIAETKDGDPDNVVMVGAHLDGVTAGPGINDNGSGSGAVLETALQMARVKPVNKVRFVWWGAEEVGLVGSFHYVNTLPSAELAKIALYLNFDMIGSPNAGYFVYADALFSGNPGSQAISSLFTAFYAERGITSQDANIVGSSDHTAFVFSGVATGGMISGAGSIKSAAQAALWGGTAGVAFDPCYHAACDTYDNVNLAALDVNADAVAHATLTFAMNTTLVNGIKGKGNFKPGAMRAPASARSHQHDGDVQ